MTTNKDAVVYAVHCIDTEGPLSESLEATFERIQDLFGLQLKPSRRTLRQLQEEQIDLNGIESDVARVISPKLLDYNDSWEKIDNMLDGLLSADYRSRFVDSFGKPYLYNWYCLDHVDFEINPRGRDLGHHKIFDHYQRKLKATQSSNDGLYIHFHPVPFGKQAHYCSTNFLSHTNFVFRVLARRIIDRRSFPASHRPGCNTLRPDSHWFLEQYIPFDYSNYAFENPEGLQQADFLDGRFADWRRTQHSWEVYHPSHDDYQQRGNCRRWIARCLPIGTRVFVTQDEVNRAFREASQGLPVVLAYSDHDWRNIRGDVEEMSGMLARAQTMYPDVRFEYCNAVEAMRKALALPEKPPTQFEIEFRRSGKSGERLHINTDSPIFGPQPFLAVKTKDGRYYHDNLDFEEPFRSWTYVFDHMTLPFETVEAVGIAANDAVGNTTVCVISADKRVETSYLNVRPSPVA